MKKGLSYVSFLTLLICISLLGVTLCERGIASFFVTDEEVEATPVIILDAGHGGEDGGATGTSGVLEKDLNLSVTRTLADLLRLAGYTVIETRTEDRLLCDEDTPKGRRKLGDLNGRLLYTEQYPNSVLISVHMNTFPNDSCRGTQVWYSQNDERSLAFAQAIQETIKKELQPSNNRKVKAATSSIYLLRHAKTPAILIECGFLSTPDECEALATDAYQKALALTIFSAICDKMPCESVPSML